MLEKLQDYSQAINSYEQALSIQSNKYEAWDNRGYTLARLGRYQEAIASLERSLQIKPDHANAYYNRAYCYGAMGNIKSALIAQRGASHKICSGRSNLTRPIEKLPKLTRI